MGSGLLGSVAVIPSGFDLCDRSDVFAWKRDSSVKRTQEWL